MAFNTAGLKVNVPLTNLVVMNTQSDDEYIADSIFKKTPVVTRTGTWYVHGKEHLREEDTLLGPRGIANEATSSISQPYTYLVQDYGSKEFLPDSDLENTLPEFRMILKESVSMKRVESLKINREIKAANKLFNVTTMSGHTQALGVADRFDNPTSDVKTIIGDAISTVKLACYKRANTIILGGQVWNKLKNHPDLLALTKNDADRIVTLDTLKRFFNYNNFKITNIFLGDSVKNTTAEGVVVETSDYIWGKYLMVCYIDPAQSTINSVSLCKNFTMGSTSYKIQVFKQSPEEKGNWYRAETSYDDEVVDAACGFLYSTAVS